MKLSEINYLGGGTCTDSPFVNSDTIAAASIVCRGLIQ